MILIYTLKFAGYRNISALARLRSGTALIMGGQMQEEFLHAVPRDQSIGGKINLTFRHLSIET